MQTCNLSTVKIQNRSKVYLTFVVPSTIPLPFTKTDDESIYCTIRTKDYALSHAFSNYVSTRLAFDLTYRCEGMFDFEETPTNIKNLSNLLNILVYDYYVEDNMLVEFVDDNKRMELKGYKYKFSKELAQELFAEKKYDECFNYITQRIDYVFVNFNGHKVNLGYSLIAQDVINIITDDEFTDEHFAFYYSSALVDLEEYINEEVDDCEIHFNKSTIVGLFEHVENPFVYDLGIETQEDLVDVLRGFVKAAYVDLVFVRTLTPLLPSVVRDDVFDDAAFVIKHDITSKVMDVICEF